MFLLQFIVCNIFLSLLFASCTNGKQICYGELGCFESSFTYGGSFEKPIAVLPEDPLKINTTFILYNRNLPNTGLVIK